MPAKSIYSFQSDSELLLRTILDIGECIFIIRLTKTCLCYCSECSFLLRIVKNTVLILRRQGLGLKLALSRSW